MAPWRHIAQKLTKNHCNSLTWSLLHQNPVREATYSSLSLQKFTLIFPKRGEWRGSLKKPSGPHETRRWEWTALTRVPQGLGAAGRESSASSTRAPLETISVLLSHLACIYVVPEKGFLFLNYACGFAPLFSQNQAKCYATTLHKLNDTTWLELFPEIWHSSGTLKVLKGLDARAKSSPLESHRGSTSTYTPVTYIFLDFCEFNQKVYMQSPWKTRGTMAWGHPELGGAI